MHAPDKQSPWAKTQRSHPMLSCPKNSVCGQFLPLPLFSVAYLCPYQLLCAGAKTWKPACSHPHLLDSNFSNALSINLACSSEQLEWQWYCGWSELSRAPRGEESTCFRIMCFLQILALAGLARALVVVLVTADVWMVMLIDWPERMHSPLKHVSEAVRG